MDYGPFSKSHNYTYYANGLKKSFTGPDNIEYAYTYDQNNRLAGIDIPGQGNITYQVFKWNSPVKVSYPGGAGSEYQYDPLMRIKKILEYDPAQNPVMTREYEYSQGSNVLAKKTEHGDYSYGYDHLYRLNQEIRPDFADNRQLVTDDYSYDAIGNRLSKTGVPGAWSYNANAELLGFGNTSFQYDPNGNMTNRTAGISPTNGTNYIYDVADQLIQVRDQDFKLIADYAYDPFGRRLWKQVDGKRIYYVYSDEGLIAEYDQQGSLIKTYGYRPNSQWTTDPLFQKIGDAYYWYKNDAQGTPQKIVDTSGRVVWEARYDAFGNCAVITQEIENNLRLAGQYFDAETGLYYNFHRYYDPVLGRYLQTDPYREGLNLYAYCHNNPNSFIDPMGLCKVKKGWQFAKAYLRFRAAQERYLIQLLFSPFYMLADWMGNQDNLFWQIWGADIYAVTKFLEGMALGGSGFIDNVLDFMADPSLGNVPILGPLLGGAWDANVEAYNNPNLDTICKAVEADLTVALFALTIAEAAGVGKGSVAAEGDAAGVGKGAPTEGICFVAGTLAQIQEGLKPIEEIKTNDKVLSRNETTGEFAWCDVVRTFINFNQEVIEVEFEKSNGQTEKTRCTLKHPFWVKDFGWTAADELVPDYEIFTSSREWVKFKGSIKLLERQTVYNFEVKGLHNYFVGEIGLWVHNSSRAGDFSKSQKNAAKAENAAEAGGKMACIDCGNTLENIQNQKGVPTPPNQAQVHHDPPIVEGGGQHSKPIVVCPGCHRARHVR